MLSPEVCVPEVCALQESTDQVGAVEVGLDTGRLVQVKPGRTRPCQ